MKFRPGEVVAKGQPFVHILNHEEKGQRCDYCFAAREALKRCSKCKMMYYCDVDCQQKDWRSAHKYDECQFYFEDRTSPTCVLARNNLYRMVLRLAVVLENKPYLINQSELVYDKKHRAFTDLMSHSDEIKGLRLRYFEKLWTYMQKLNLNISRVALLEYFGKICINSFSILNHSLNEIGFGLYINISIFDHSCQPNAAPTFDGTKLEVRATSDIDTDTEEVLISYIDCKLPLNKRRTKLEEQYYFECQCPRCVKNEEEDFKLEDLNRAFDNEIETGNWKTAYAMGLKTLPLYERVYKTYYPDFTVQLVRIVKIALNVEPQIAEESLKFLISRAKESLLVTHGEGHSLYKEFSSLIF